MLGSEANGNGSILRDESDPRLRQIAESIRLGHRLERADAVYLATHASTALLGSLADGVRQRINPGNIVTYLVDRNINYTNVCNTDCSFCAFYRHSSSHPEAYVLSKKELGQKIEEALSLGATRILLQGGHNDDLPYSFYTDLIAWIHLNFQIDINAFSPSEIAQMSKISGRSPRDILAELKDCGLHGLPGGGAELLDEDIRKRVSPKKITSDEWVSIMEDAHSLRLVTTCSMVIGFNETIEQRMNHLDRLRNAQDRSLARGFEGWNCFISWTLVHNENTSIGRSRHRELYGANVEEYMRNLALCRIYLDNVRHHQASWPTYGPEVAQQGLHFGCNDIGSTMMEENVVSQAGAPTKEKWSMSPLELREHIRGAGYVPAQRNSKMEILRVFEVEGDETSLDRHPAYR